MQIIRNLIGTILLLLLANLIYGQQANVVDSLWIRVKPSYDSVSKFHRKVFGENYRKEYAMATKVPVLRMSQLHGGLMATEKGGGNQSRSLRLVDKNGAEWVLRSVEKYPEVLLPPSFRNTVAKDIIKDNMVSQHPFSALVVAELAAAVGVPHSTPVIGWVVADPNLGEFSSDFANSLCLLELREPLGNSDNTEKMYVKLNNDNDILFDANLYLKAKALDVLIGDWDRHEDQWRWKQLKGKQGTVYVPIPRDRDQVFFRSDGLIQKLAQSSWLLPMMQGYERDIKDINWFLWEGRELNSRFFANMSEQEWNATIEGFCSEITDQVLERSLMKLPISNSQLQYGFLEQLKRRRKALPEMMTKYYHFYHKIIDIEVTNKDEKIEVSDTGNKALYVKVTKAKQGNAIIFDKVFDPGLTKEIRIYTHNGNDSLLINNKTSPVKIRIIGGEGNKLYQIEQSHRAILLYGKTTNATYKGAAIRKLTKSLADDSANVAYVAKDLYKRKFTFLNAGYNPDDGLLLGMSYRIKHPGFRKSPYRDSQTFSFLHSFATSAFKFNYKGQWNKLLGNLDFLIDAEANAPSNTQNFFGFGNQTKFDDSVDGISYYRTRFDRYHFDPSLSYQNDKIAVKFGPSLSYYRYNVDDNLGRFITNSELLHSNDSLTIAKDKVYAGLTTDLIFDSRDNSILPKTGALLELKLQGHKGLNRYAESFAQLNIDFSFYQKIGPSGNLTIAERIGGGITAGRPAFFQSQFLGGQGNLSGFRQYRFAGKHIVYNNLEIRLRLGNFVNYIIPGEIGLLGLYDVGRVWVPNEKSNSLHQGFGGGFYFAPASLTVLRVMASHSNEGWYPYVSLGFRY
ncbi:hypothetical protein EZ428_17905 [Pedobacter frigiditerrae]|uniref:Bacterial surface antigen (D15) domain-containing protein n=1 Tax=Pedobacter frigiditerrae TaxID=2530452 RepID=A0A4R0MPR0_9SPHI|nr:BamA/TamA family outer membrane protein [Pedobacter frigiditerrae]TCC88517.1 hypothetical protein EZ428_17905 [Pedobacter frigiditerrae]